MFNNITNGEVKENDTAAAFMRKGLARTPPKGTSSTNETSAQASAKVKGLRRKLKTLEKTLKDLSEFVSKYTNINTDIKKMVAKAGLEMTGAMMELDNAEAELDKAGPQAAAVPAPQVRMEITQETPRSTTPAFTWKTVEKRKRSVEETKGQASKTRKRDGPEATPRTATGRQQNGQKPSKNGQTTSKKMTMRPRADAIVVEKVGETTSYADILKMVKSDPNLKEIGEKVTRIKRNQKGQMMFELAREEGAKREVLQDAVSKALEGLAKVTVRTQEANIVCKDIDEVTTKEDVLKALTTELQIDGLPATAIRSLRASYGGTQTAVISLPFEYARRIVKAGKIKIGWTICRVREATKPTACFRCLDFGHLAKDCKGEDRSKLCRKCGKEGHIAMNCEQEPRCMICSTKDKIAPHVTGSIRCPKFTRSRSSTKADKT